MKVMYATIPAEIFKVMAMKKSEKEKYTFIRSEVEATDGKTLNAANIFLIISSI